MNRDELRVRAKMLENQVREKTVAVESGQISKAAYHDFVEKAYRESESIDKTLSNFNSAIASTMVPLDSEVHEKAVDKDDIRPMNARTIVKAYDGLRNAAVNKTPNSSFVFDLNIKTPGYRTRTSSKALVNPYDPDGVTQGVTGLQGEGATGTTVAAMPLGDYFLTGPGGPDITPQWVPGILELRWYENLVAQLMPVFPTDSPVVSWVRETAWNNMSVATAEGGQFPTSTNTIKRMTMQIGKVANLSRVTDEEIQDSQYFWALVQKRTTMGVTRKEEVELLAGSGYPGVDGLLNNTTEFTQAQTIDPVTNLQVPNQSNPGVGAYSDTISSVTPGRQIVGTGSNYPDGFQIVEGVLAALTDIRINHFFEPTAIVMNPLDWFIVRTMTDANKQFMAGSMWGYDYGNAHDVDPAIQATDPNLLLWGKRVVNTPAMPQGYILVGDFTDATAVLRRGGMRVEIVNTNGFDFQEGLWSMRAYTRVGLAIYRPELFELIQLTNG